MEDKQTRTMTWMAGILVALVAAVVLLGDQEGGGGEGGGDGEVKTIDPFPDLTADAITTLALTPADRPPIRLSRQEDGSWALTSPFASAADAQTVQAVLEALESMECSEEALRDAPASGEAPDADDLAQFGLQPPRLAVLASTAEGVSYSLRVGKDTPVGWTSYVQCGEDAAPRTSKQKLSDIFLSDVNEFRARDALRLKALDDIRAIEIIAADEENARHIRLRTDDSGLWFLGDGPRPADQGRATDIHQKLRTVSVASFDAPPLMPPIYTIRLINDSGLTDEILVGENGSATVPLQDAPVTLSVDLSPILSLSETELLSRDLFRIQLGEAAAIDIAIPGHAPLQAQRDANGWTHPAAENVIATLQVVRVDRASPPTNIPPDLAPWGSLRVTTASQQKQDVFLYSLAETQNAYPARDATTGEVFWIPNTDVARIQDALKQP